MMHDVQELVNDGGHCGSPTRPPPTHHTGTIDNNENAKLLESIQQIPGVHEVKKCVVTDLDFDSQKRRAEVIVVSIRASDRNVGATDGPGRLIAQVRHTLARFGVREAWATVEVEYTGSTASARGAVAN